MTARPTLLVTGAGGGVGRRLRARLEADGYQASYLLRPGSTAHPDHPSVDVADITDVDRLTAIVDKRRPTAIIHLAALVGAACDVDPGRTQDVNVDAVGSLADIARTHAVPRFVLASTSAVYGDGYLSPIAETDELAPASRYAQSKRSAELTLAAAAEQSGSFSAVALRIFNVFGPGISESLVNRLVNATPDAPVTLAGLDTFVRDYVHVDDVVDALLLASEAPSIQSCTVVNVGSGVPTSNRDLVEALNPVSYLTGPPRSSYSCADVALARHLLGFSARRTVSRSSATDEPSHTGADQ